MRMILYLTAFLFAVSPAFADNTCGEKCTWEIIDGELKIHGTGNMANYDYEKVPWYSQRNSIRKISIDEGISGIGNLVFYNIPATSISIPSTLKSIGYESFRGSGIHSLNLPEGFEKLGSYALIGINQPVEIPASIKSVGGIGNGAGGNLIINAKDNFEFSAGSLTGFNGVLLNSLNIQCKGDIKVCQNMLKKVKKYTEDNGKEFNLGYYSGLNKNGNWEVWSDNGKAVYADLSMSKLLAKYDFDGNQTGFYQYDKGGNLIKAIENGLEVYRRRIYTISEATAAVSGKNTFKLKYR